MPPSEQMVFIVDDDADDRDSIRDAFLERRQEVSFVFMRSADELIRKLRDPGQASPAVILLDLNMPGKSGRDALQEIKSDKTLQPIPVIILTTSSSPKDRQAVLRAGANGFVTKPDTFNRLVQLTDAIATLWLDPR